MVQWDGMVKVLGFGISSMNGLTGVSTKVPEVLHYTSPEQLRGEACDHRSALFSLGAILYEMATERKAFEGDTAEQVRSAILDTSTASAASARKPNLSHGLSALIMKAISKSPENRFQSCQDLLREIEQCNSSGPRPRLRPPRRNPKLRLRVAGCGCKTCAQAERSSPRRPRPRSPAQASQLSSSGAGPPKPAAPAAAKPPTQPEIQRRSDDGRAG